MKITNRNNLPKAFYDMINDNIYQPTEKSYSVTTLLSPIQLNVLHRRHFDKIEEDISDMTNLIFGSALHNEIKRHDKTEYSEHYLNYEIKNGYRLSGQIDLYDEQNFELVDYKTCSSWKIINQDFDDWHKQGAMYSWLLLKHGKIVDKIRFIAFIKDWSSSKAKYDKNYPSQPIFVYESKMNNYELNKIEEFIYQKFDEIIENEKKNDNELTPCSDKETWFTGNKFAVMKKGNTKALKLFDTYDEASTYVSEKNTNGLYIDKRIGQHRRCEDFCPVKNFCSQYKNTKETV